MSDASLTRPPRTADSAPVASRFRLCHRVLARGGGHTLSLGEDVRERRLEHEGEELKPVERDVDFTTLEGAKEIPVHPRFQRDGLLCKTRVRAPAAEHAPEAHAKDEHGAKLGRGAARPSTLYMMTTYIGFLKQARRAVWSVPLSGRMAGTATRAAVARGGAA